MAEHRCTVCGASRILGAFGRPGACSLVPGRDGTGGCPDPLFDYDREAAEVSLRRLVERAMSGVEPDREDRRGIDNERAAIAKMLGVSGPRSRGAQEKGAVKP